MNRIINKKDDEINSLNTKNRGLNENIAELEQKLNSDTRDDEEKLALKEKLKISENKVNELNIKLSMLNTKYDNERKSKEKLQNELNLLKGEKEASVKENDENLNENNDLKNEDNENLNNEVKSRNNNNNEEELRSKKEMEDMILKTKTYEDENQRLQNLNLDLNQKLEDSNKRYTESEKKNLEYSEEIKKLTKEKEELSNKITKMKEALQEIKQKLELELNQKIDARNKIINDMNKEFSLKETNYNEKIKKLTKEKLDYEELIIKQDSKVNELGNKLNQIDILLKNKNQELKNNEAQAESLIKIIEDQKRQIFILKEEKKIFSNYESELIYLRNFNESLKDDALAKDEIIRDLKNKLVKTNKHSSPGNFSAKFYLSTSGTNDNSRVKKDEENNGTQKLPDIAKIKQNKEARELKEIHNLKELKQYQINEENKKSIEKEESENRKKESYEKYLKLENEEKNQNDKNYEKLQDLFKKALEL